MRCHLYISYFFFKEIVKYLTMRVGIASAMRFQHALGDWKQRISSIFKSRYNYSPSELVTVLMLCSAVKCTRNTIIALVSFLIKFMLKNRIEYKKAPSSHIEEFCRP